MGENFSLQQSLATRKYSLASAVDILQELTDISLGGILPPGHARQILRDRLDQLTASETQQTQDIEAIVARLLLAINEMTGQSFVVADLRDGTVPLSAVVDSIKAVAHNHKMLIYKPFSLGVITGQAYSEIELSAELLTHLDSEDWSNPLYGGFAAPFNLTAPVLISSAYLDFARVDLLYHSDHLPVFDEQNQPVLGYVSEYTGNVAHIVWGRMTPTGFMASALPLDLLAQVEAVVPLKTNFGVMPVDALTMGRSGSIVVDNDGGEDISYVKQTLLHNKLTVDTRLSDVLGLSNITMADFMAATVTELVPTGYSSIVEAVVGILNYLQARVGLDELDLRVGRVEEDANVAIGQTILSVMPEEYTVAVIDTFRTDENEFVGGNKAVIDTEAALLRHGRDDVDVVYYLQQVRDEMEYKTKVSFKLLVAADEPLFVLGEDFEVTASLEVKGPRYPVGISYELLHYVGSLPTDKIQFELVEYDLQTLPHDPNGDAPLAPIIGLAETVWLRIAIKKDSAGQQATPVIRSYQLFA